MLAALNASWYAPAIVLQSVLARETMKRIILEFIGGYWDGKTLDTASSDPDEASLASGYYLMTHEGTIGKGFEGVSEEAVAYAHKHGWEAAKDVGFRWGHVYRVIERLEEGDEILVRLKYSLKSDATAGNEVGEDESG